jgi:outer membrane protein assembly factor BamD
MTLTARLRGRRVALSVALAGLVALTACGKKKANLPEGQIDPAKFLFDRGTQGLQTKRWLKAREYFQELYDKYPQSPYRTDAKLGLGDAMLGEGSTEALVLAGNEFREFLTFFPTNPRADYAQYKLALSHSRQMLKPDRDQTQTKEAIKELETFLARYPGSTLMNEGRKKLREARDRLSQSEYLVGYHYYQWRVWSGAISRLLAILRDDPEYTYRDAVYYYLGETLLRTELKAQALPYFARLVEEFQESQYLAKAQQRIKELKTAAAVVGR